MFYRLKDLQEFSILAPDGEIGRVFDFYFDDQGWNVRYLVIETGTLGLGHRILLSPADVGEPVPESKQIPVSLASEQLKDSPEIDLLIGETESQPPQKREEELGANEHLRSVREVSVYAIRAREGEAGHIEDFLVDETWAIRYLVVDTGIWLPGRKVLFAPAWVTAIHPDRAEFEVDLSKNTIKNSPEYDPQISLDREYEHSLYDHYGRPRYWD